MGAWWAKKQALEPKTAKGWALTGGASDKADGRSGQSTPVTTPVKTKPGIP